MFPRTVMWGYSAYDWNTIAMSRSWGFLSSITRVPSRRWPVRDRLQPGDHPECRRLPAARRADEDQKLPVGDVDRYVFDGDDLAAVVVREHLAQVVEFESCHG